MSNLLKIDKRFIDNNAVDGEKILLLVGQTLRGLNSENQEIDLLAKLLEEATSYADDKIAALVGDSPELLDTLKELADAINNDPEFFSSISTLISTLEGKVDQEILDREAGDTQVLEDAKDYTDAQIATIPAVDLSNYETIANVDSKDAATLASAQSYTDSEVAAEALARETVDNLLRSEIDDANAAREAGDVQALQDAKDYTDAQIALIPEVDLSAVEADIAALQAADTVLDGKIDAEKARIDAILLASDADKDSFAEIVQLINSVDTENDQAFAGYVLSNDAALAQEVSDRQAADAALQAQIDNIEVAANAKEVVEVESISGLSTGNQEIIYVDKSDDRIYRWGEALLEGEYDFTVGSSGDFATIEQALASASVVDGSIIRVLNGTYTLSSQLVINKQVKIYGQSLAGVIIQSEAASTAPVNLISITANNVAFLQMTVKHRKTTNTTIESAMAVSGANCIVAGCRVEYMEFGIVSNAAIDFSIDSNRLVHTGASNNANRSVGIYGMSGECFVTRCLFDNNGVTTANVVPVFIADRPTSGKLVVSQNQSVNQVFQFIVFTGNLTGSERSFDLVVEGNITNETSAYILVTANTTKVINSITVANNQLSHRHTPSGGGKGLVTFYGNGGDWGIIDLHISNNTVQDDFFRAGYSLFTQLKDSLGNPITTGYDAGRDNTFTEPTINVTVDSVIAALPTQPSNPDILDSVVEQFIELSATDLSPLDARLTAIEGDLAIEVSNRIAADSALQSQVNGNASGLAQEILDRQAGDTVLDGKIDAEKARIDAILLASDADKDSFAEIVQLINSVDTENDQAFAGYVASNDAALAQEVLDREAGDQAIKQYKPDQVIYVSKNGADTNVGSEQLPFLTLGAALASITDASPSKRYAIRVSSGSYVETNLSLKANVFIIGEGAKEAVRIDSIISLDSSFSGSGDHRSGFANVLILKACNFDWSAVTSAAGKLYCSQTVFGQAVTMYGHNNAIAQAQFADCQFFGKLTVSGINISVFHNNFCWAGIDLNQHPNGGMATILNAVGGTISGELKLTTTVIDFNRRCSAFLKSCYTGQISIDGASSYVDATNDSIPVAGANITSGGNLIRLNDSGANRQLSNLSFPTAVNSPIMPATTNATNFGDWGKQWFWNFGYVHASTGTDLFLISYGSSFGADSVGRNVAVIADGAGLAENVNGGNVSLSTAAVTGTGIRGKIILDGKEIDVTSKQIKNLADGTDETDAVNKGQLDSVESRVEALENAPDSVLFEEDVRFNITTELNYIDLPHLAKAIFKVSVNRLNAFKGTDYTISQVGSVTRITWAGDFVQPDGELALKSGDVVHVTYAR